MPARTSTPAARARPRCRRGSRWRACSASWSGCPTARRQALEEDRGPVGQAANAALKGPVGQPAAEAVEAAVGRMEAALRAHRVESSR